MKMRRMIFFLDNIGDTALAESLMDYAEPPAGMYGCSSTIDYTTSLTAALPLYSVIFRPRVDMWGYSYILLKLSCCHNWWCGS